VTDDIDRLRQRIKGMQLRRDKVAEAKAQAELGLMCLAEDIDAAAVAFARAKRLCRDIQRGKP